MFNGALRRHRFIRETSALTGTFKEAMVLSHSSDLKSHQQAISLIYQIRTRRESRHILKMIQYTVLCQKNSRTSNTWLVDSLL